VIYDPLAGSWTYRSFVNRTDLLPNLDPEHIVKDDVAKWSRYMFGQGVMTFHPTATGALTGRFEMGDEQNPLDMLLNGKIEERDGVTWIKWNAHGLPGTPSDGWLYEYDAYYTAKWPNGRRQIEAIVGSVIRSQPHDDLAPNQTADRAARAGAVTSFIMVRPAFVEAHDVIPLPPVMLEMVGSRAHRLLHAIWHGLRDNWVTPADGDIPAAEKAEITALGWAPPHPNQFPTRGTVDQREPDNGAGEDFLFMHRRMIHEVRELLEHHGLPTIEAWKSIPAPNRQSRNHDGFSVPPAWDAGQGENSFKGLATIKSDEYWQSRMTFLERKFKEQAYLATLTLDQLGAKIEWLIHNLMHIRWCSQQTQPDDPLTPLPGGRPLTETSDKWIKTVRNDKPFYYDDLNDTFSSHVHPVFWRLHGWVDDRVEDWYAAHDAAHPGQVVRRILGPISWFAKGPWVSVEAPWVGPPGAAHEGHGGGGDHEHGRDDRPGFDVAVMQRVYDLIFNPAATAVIAPSGTRVVRGVRTAQFTAKMFRE
jgi:hypothetical protein